jgi:hypothetical protein
LISASVRTLLIRHPGSAPLHLLESASSLSAALVPPVGDLSFQTEIAAVVVARDRPRLLSMFTTLSTASSSALWPEVEADRRREAFPLRSLSEVDAFPSGEDHADVEGLIEGS